MKRKRLITPVVGIIGLGTMGQIIACHLQKRGLLRAVFDIDLTRTSTFPKNKVVGDARQVAQKCNVIILCLPTPFDVRRTADILFSNTKFESVIIDLSTNSPDLTRSLFNKFRKLGIDYLEAPMLGGVRAVRRHRLKLIVGGDEEVLLKVRPVLQIFAHSIIYLGEAGNANTMKLVHNMITLSNAVIAIEAITIGQKAGLDLATLFLIIKTGTASSYVVNNTLKRTLLKGNWKKGFKLRLAAKDLMLADELASEVGIRPYVINRVIELFKCAAQDTMLADIDYPVIEREITRRLHTRSENIGIGEKI